MARTRRGVSAPAAPPALRPVTAPVLDKVRALADQVSGLKKLAHEAQVREADGERGEAQRRQQLRRAVLEDSFEAIAGWIAMDAGRERAGVDHPVVWEAEPGVLGRLAAQVVAEARVCDLDQELRDRVLDGHYARRCDTSIFYELWRS